MLGDMDENKNPPRYEIHLRGQLSDRLLSAFPELRARSRNHETLLTGALPDQSALHGVLARIEGAVAADHHDNPAGSDSGSIE